jgi:hypothetical protein
MLPIVIAAAWQLSGFAMAMYLAETTLETGLPDQPGRSEAGFVIARWVSHRASP